MKNLECHNATPCCGPFDEFKRAQDSPPLAKDAKVNPARWTELQARLRQNGSAGKLRFTACPGDAVRFAQALGCECDIVGAVGGDGTLFEMASGLRLSGATNTALGLIPLDTGKMPPAIAASAIPRRCDWRCGATAQNGGPRLVGCGGIRAG